MTIHKIRMHPTKKPFMRIASPFHPFFRAIDPKNAVFDEKGLKCPKMNEKWGCFHWK